MAERPSDQPTIREFTSKKRKNDEFHDELVTRSDKITFQRMLVQWIADANLSFRMPKHDGLQKIFLYLNPVVEETSANLTHATIRTRIIDEFHTYKAHVIDTLLRSPGLVHIAFDGWTSRNRHAFFSINAFFLDEDTFQPRKVLLGLPTMTIDHTGKNICGAVTDVLNEFELAAHHKVGYLILDNATNNDSTVESLTHRLGWREAKPRRIRCFGHVLHCVA
jgi:hypothetical protein